MSFFIYNYLDNINLEGATIPDDGTKIIWNAFNFCLLAEGIVMANNEIAKEDLIVLSANYWTILKTEYISFLAGKMTAEKNLIG